MGEVVFRQLVNEAGIADRFEITSRGTGDWHVGNQADPRTLVALAAAGYDGEAHRAAQLGDEDFTVNQLLVALDRGHERVMRERGADPDQLVLLTKFDPDQPSDPDVFDPYFSDDEAFTRVLTQVERSCRALLTDLRTQLSV